MFGRRQTHAGPIRHVHIFLTVDLRAGRIVQLELDVALELVLDRGVEHVPCDRAGNDHAHTVGRALVDDFRQLRNEPGIAVVVECGLEVDETVHEQHRIHRTADLRKCVRIGGTPLGEHPGVDAQLHKLHGAVIDDLDNRIQNARNAFLIGLGGHTLHVRQSLEQHQIGAAAGDAVIPDMRGRIEQAAANHGSHHGVGQFCIVFAGDRIAARGKVHRQNRLAALKGPIFLTHRQAQAGIDAVILIPGLPGAHQLYELVGPQARLVMQLREPEIDDRRGVFADLGHRADDGVQMRGGELTGGQLQFRGRRLLYHLRRRIHLPVDILGLDRREFARLEVLHIGADLLGAHVLSRRHVLLERVEETELTQRIRSDTHVGHALGAAGGQLVSQWLPDNRA
ncbi:Uncharacterised protein [Mycobacteroides abscessus subsp. abscessus]|nr:Uncharacterised protein [Mycobacteroides abscessus subsp. abscessus]